MSRTSAQTRSPTRGRVGDEEDRERGCLVNRRHVRKHGEGRREEEECPLASNGALHMYFYAKGDVLEVGEEEEEVERRWQRQPGERTRTILSQCATRTPCTWCPCVKIH